MKRGGLMDRVRFTWQAWKRYGVAREVALVTFGGGSVQVTGQTGSETAIGRARDLRKLLDDAADRMDQELHELEGDREADEAVGFLLARCGAPAQTSEE